MYQGYWWCRVINRKSEAYLKGDFVVTTLVDNDLDTSSAAETNSTIWVKAVPSGETTGVGNWIKMTETSGNSGTFKGTFITGATTSLSATDAPTIRAVANGTIVVTYKDTTPAQDITQNVTTKNFGAILDIASSSVPLDGNAVVSLYDPESNVAVINQDFANVNVKSTTDSSCTTLRLTETGNDTGSFLGTNQVRYLGYTTIGRVGYDNAIVHR